MFQIRTIILRNIIYLEHAFDFIFTSFKRFAGSKMAMKSGKARNMI